MKSHFYFLHDALMCIFADVSNLETSPAPYVDFHTHRLIEGSETITVVSMNGIPDREALFYTAGYHPWWLGLILTSGQLETIRNLYHNEAGCLGIGECGLDALKGLSLDLQEKNFIMQLELANSCQAPVVIHCVRAFDRLLRLAKTYKKTPWVVHGFVRNKVLARQVLDAGICLSIAPENHMNSSFSETLAYIPVEDIFLETDSDRSLSIQQRYNIFARLRSLEENKLKEILFDNFKRFFAQKWKFPHGWKGQNC